MAQHFLSTALRRKLSSTVEEGRKLATEGAADAIRRLGVGDAKAPVHLDEGRRRLRNALRAHGRALGDMRDAGTQAQSVAKLSEAAAYEHWHRMLFARFLAERGLLIHPKNKVRVTLEDCRDLAAEEGLKDAWAVAERYATRMLPGIFRPDDPVLGLELAPERAQVLQRLVTGLEPAVFEASDSLGWTYQFWRTAEKEAINKSGRKIGGDELPAVTQLFTEPYMVQFLLHNTLGAWWAGKVLALKPELAKTAPDEAALRAACALPGIDWAYLRFVQEDGVWSPAAGTFPGWPECAAEITVMDPCCGSGHFLTEAFGIVAALRMAAEGLSRREAAAAVLRDNLFGLEIDGRCVQIALFAVALAAWRLAGEVIDLPVPHVAWVGQKPAVSGEEWLRLAETMAASGPVPPKRDLLGSDDNLFSKPDRWALELLWDLFEKAPVLGSLRDLGTVQPLFAEKLEGFEAALAKVAFGKSDADELALAARGMADAALMLGRRYTLQATNVPYLGRGKQAPELAGHLAREFPEAKADIATAMLTRMLKLAARGGTVASITPQNWLFLGSYKKMRERLLRDDTLAVVAVLGEHGFESPMAAGAFTALVAITAARPGEEATFAGLDANEAPDPPGKAQVLRQAEPRVLRQAEQRANPDARLSIKGAVVGKLLSAYADSYVGFQNGDTPRWVQQFWEQPSIENGWNPFQLTSDDTQHYDGRHSVLKWDEGAGELAHSDQARIQGTEAWDGFGVIVRHMRDLPCGLYVGDMYDQSSAVIVPREKTHLAAVWAFCSSADFGTSVRSVDRALKVTNATLVKVPFDLEHWQKVATERYPTGLPEPYSDDPTQWLFHGHPAKAEPGAALQVALARLAGYRWPAESDKEMRLAQEAREWVARAATLPAADEDGILCIPSVGGERPLAERLRSFLAACFGPAWSAETERRLLAEAAEKAKEKAAADLEDWLRNRFFRQHCALFHQRPFLWQVWDGTRDGFSGVLHYHRLTKANLQKLAYTYLGDWIARMQNAKDERRASAARILQQKLELILKGEPPYDIFVRWKPLARLPMGWDPDLDDGVRMNIRPFVEAGVLRETPRINWNKDRGTDVKSAPWYPVFKGERINDHHTTLAEKRTAREAALAKLEA